MEKLKFRQQVTATTTESSLENNNTIGDAYDCVTVLLCDIVGMGLLLIKRFIILLIYLCRFYYFVK